MKLIIKRLKLNYIQIMNLNKVMKIISEIQRFSFQNLIYQIMIKKK